MKKIIFIHGMFQNAKSWNGWVDYFAAKGYQCIAESWPMHEGEPEALRNNIPDNLGDLRLEEVYEKFVDLIGQNRDAILIGHSVGGLLVQKLISNGYGSLGVCISSVAPNRMLSLDWGFFKNSISIANPLKGDEPFYMMPDGFHASFCNPLTKDESDKYFHDTVVHDSRNVLRDCMLEPGHIDLEKTTKKLLFIGAEEDEIIPPKLNEKNVAAYPEGIATFHSFPGRGHFICGQPGWEEVARYVLKWIGANEPRKESL